MSVTRSMIRQHYLIEDRASHNNRGMKETRYRCLHCEAEGRTITFCESAKDFQWAIMDLLWHLQEWHDVHM